MKFLPDLSLSEILLLLFFIGITMAIILKPNLLSDQGSDSVGDSGFWGESDSDGDGSSGDGGGDGGD